MPTILLTMHEWDVIFTLVEKEIGSLEGFADTLRRTELEKIRTKIEESVTL